MSLRLIFCPVIGTGGVDDAYRPKIDGLADYTCLIPSNPDGSPKFGWCVCIARAPLWAVIDADAAMERVFGIDLPDTINTFPELKAFLQSRTVADIPQARRQALNDKLTAKGIDTSQVTLATTWWQVARGIARHLHGRLPDGIGMNL